MKKKLQKKYTLRMFWLTAVALAIFATTSVFLAAYASEEAALPDTVSNSDAAEATEKDAAVDSEKIVISKTAEIKRSYFTVSQTVDARHYRFKPDGNGILLVNRLSEIDSDHVFTPFLNNALPHHEANKKPRGVGLYFYALHVLTNV